MKIIFFTAFFLGFLGGASAQRAPTDAELKSAYCIHILSTKLSWIKNEIPDSRARAEENKGTEIGRLALESVETLENLLLKTQADLSRLRSYLVPRIPGIDILALEMARGRAKEDFQLATNNSCAVKCNDFDTMRSCIAKCDEAVGGPRARTWTCKKIDFLPF